MKSQWTIGKKLIVSFLGLAAITLILGLLGFWGANKSGGSIEEIGMVRLPSVDSLRTIKGRGNEIKAAQRSLLDLGMSKEDRARQHETLAKAQEVIDAAWKVYEPLPQTPEEAQIWKQFVPAWSKWREENNKFFEMNRKIDALDLGDPLALNENMEAFRGDHWKLTAQVMQSFITGKNFEGGEDAAACNFGKWLASFKTTNPELLGLMQKVAEPHRKFHEGVKKTKELAAAGKRDQAASFYNSEVAASQDASIVGLRQMRALTENAIATADEASQMAMGSLRQTQNEANDLLDKILKINTDIAASTS